ncbi:MAG TPA: hypothetical protein PKK33_11290, partial [Candidatus Cloacimonadota bacterium]|nr:hypothetical protein [Candidatus Cloacimonadota bacterium]
ASCDKRDGEKPIISLIADTDSLYNVANHDTVNIVCQLSGDKTSIAEQIIDVTYNPANVFFLGDGSSNYLVTDEDGYSKGLFKVHTGYYGDIAIKFSPRHYPERAKTITLFAQDMPVIDSLYAADSNFSATDPSFTDITVKISSHSPNITGKWIHFVTSVGTSIDSIRVQTDSTGTARNIFRRNAFSGTASIRAYLEVHPEDVHYLTVHCE